MLVEVALPIPVRGTFTYQVPPALEQVARRGVRARVQFGKRVLVGVILGPAVGPPPAARLKPLMEVLDTEPLLSGPLLDLTLWLADYYQAPAGEALRLALPSLPGHSPGAGAASAAGGPRGRSPAPDLVRLTPSRGTGGDELPKGASHLRGILTTLSRTQRADGWMKTADLRRAPAVSLQQLRVLERRGLIETAFAESAPRQDHAHLTSPAAGPVEAWPTLTSAQSAAASAVNGAIDAGDGSVFLLRGVTGSGKTEVYFVAARRALDRGRGVIFLVPEIALTPAFTRRVRERFGDQTALLHSRLSPAHRRLAWERIRSGRAPLVVGPRSALFAPVSRLGLLVVDEEHDASYKQEETPRYHARDLALVRARIEGAAAVLGSATPSVESWHAARAGRYRLLELEERIAGRSLPPVEIVNMREEFRRKGAPVLLSDRLIVALEEALARREQAVILLNRRGYAAFAQCRACGEPFGCPRCSVSLVYHRSDEALRCHYCGYRRGRPDACEKCGSPHLTFQGEGTERALRHLERAFPGARIVRLDRDTARGAGSHERILAGFEAGESDILVGTQMVAKGHDFPRVTVVGVLAADAILGFPDFRAAERTFQILTQVAGRAGRGNLPGCVIVQAYRNDHYALQAASRHDHEEFFQKEIEYRRALGYPPFTNLVALTVSGKNASRAFDRARGIAHQLATGGQGRVQVLGPALAPIGKIRGLFRFQILLKARARRRLGNTLTKTLGELAASPGGIRDLSVDVDPLQLL